MIGLVKPFGSLLKIRQINTSDNVFKLHTGLTAVLLLVFAALLSSKEYFGQPIGCINDATNDARQSFINNLCWTNGTFIFRNATGRFEKDYALYHGVYARNDVPDEVIYQRYYQWIGIMLVIMATLSYIPAYLWQVFEGGLMEKLCGHLDWFVLKEDSVQQKNKLQIFFNSPLTRRTLNKYAYHYFFCEFLNLLVVAVNILILDFIIPEYWSNYATANYAMLAGNQADWVKFSSHVFPKLAKCTTMIIGPSGSTEYIDSLCLLQLNVFNEKIFSVLWFWFVLLSVVSVLNVLHLFVIIPIKSYRISILKSRAMRAISRNQISKATCNGSIGYWFALNQISKNLTPAVFIEIVSAINIGSYNKKQYLKE